MSLTAKQVADQVGATVEGDGNLELVGVAAPERAGLKHLIYVEAAKYAERAAGSAALCVVAGEGVSLPGKTILKSVKPKVAFAKAAALLLEPAPIATGVHPTAIVPPQMRIGECVGIGPYAVIGDDVHIGDGTQIGAHCVIGAGCGRTELPCSFAGYALPRHAYRKSSGDSLGGGDRGGRVWLRVRWRSVLEISAGRNCGDWG